MERIDARGAEDAQRRFAGGLARAGARTGDRVVFACPSSAALLCAILGALRSGVVPVPLDPALLPVERDPLIADAEPTLVVDGTAELCALAGGPTIDLSPVPLARPMHYTSGTTGYPKGVWTGLLDEGDAAALVRDETELWGFEAGDVLLMGSPLHHSVAIRLSICVLLAGGDVVLFEHFDALDAARAIQEHRPSCGFMVPSHLRRLFALGEMPPTSSFRLMIHAGEPCPPSLKRTAIETFPAGSVWEFYGSTEGQFTVCSTPEWLERPGTVGRARPRRELAVDPVGAVWCHAPAWARFEYWRDPAATAAAWRDGWFTVRDLGHVDDDGYLYLDGRRDDLVITGGVNVYPAEIEAALAELDGVQAVAVFGVPDDRWGQRVCAAVMGDVTPALVHEFARTRLAGFKRPKDVYVVDELPHTSTGKLRRLAVAPALGLTEPGV